MSSPFKKPDLNCNAKEMLDALSIIHDLGVWDHYVIEYATEDPIGFCDRVRNDQDELLAEWERKYSNWALVLKSYGSRKINSIKTIRDFTGWRLANLKNYVESLPLILPWKYKNENEARSSHFVKLYMEDVSDSREPVETYFEFISLGNKGNNFMDAPHHKDTVFDTVYVKEKPPYKLIKVSDIGNL